MREGGVGERQLPTQPPTKPSFAPKPLKGRMKGGVSWKQKKSTYDWESSRGPLGLGHDIHPFIIYTAATASTGNAVAASTIINSHSKEEGKAENKNMKEQAKTLERKI